MEAPLSPSSGGVLRSRPVNNHGTGFPSMLWWLSPLGGSGGTPQPGRRALTGVGPFAGFGGW